MTAAQVLPSRRWHVVLECPGERAAALGGTACFAGPAQNRAGWWQATLPSPRGDFERVIVACGGRPTLLGRAVFRCLNRPCGRRRIYVVGYSTYVLSAVPLPALYLPYFFLMDIRLSSAGLPSTPLHHIATPVLSAHKTRVWCAYDIHSTSTGFCALRAGSSGFLLKRGRADALSTRCRTVARGDALSNPGPRCRPIQRSSTLSGPPLPSRIPYSEPGARENQILRLIRRAQ